MNKSTMNEIKRQLALWDLMAVSINTSNSCSINNGPRPDRLMQLLGALNGDRLQYQKLFQGGFFTR